MAGEMKKFTIEVEMPERWVNDFMSMLSYMEYLGNMGSSRRVTIYADGDGDFRPKFKADTEWKQVKPKADTHGDRYYDAG